MNEISVKKFYDFLQQRETEIRVIKDKKIKIFFVHNFDEFLKVCKENESSNLYCGIHERKANGTKDEDVINFKCIPIDLDSLNNDDIQQVETKFKESGLKFSYKICSGGGIHYYLPIPEQKEFNILKMAKTILPYLNKKIDSTVYNPSRIMRIWGTYNHNKKAECDILEENIVSEKDIQNNYYVIQDLYEASEQSIITKHKQQQYTIPLFAHLYRYPLTQENIEKDNILFKNFARYVYDIFTEDDAKKYMTNFAIKHKHNPAEVFGWYEKCKTGEITEVCLPEIMKWNKEHNLGLEKYIYKKELNKLECYSLKELKNLYLKPLTWILQDLIPSKSNNLIVGQGSSGKSFIALHLAMCIASSRKFLHLSTTKGVVVILDDESGIHRLKERTTQLELGHDKIPEDCEENLFYYPHPLIKIDKPDGVAKLKEIIEMRKPNLIIVDSLRRVLSGKENDSDAIELFYQGLKEAIGDKEIACIFIHHINKTSDGLNSVRGSSDIVNMMDNIFQIQKKDNIVTFECIKGRDLPEVEPFCIKFNFNENLVDGERIYPNWVAKFEYEPNPDTTKTERASEEIEQYIDDEGLNLVRTKDIKSFCKDSDIKYTTMYSALRILTERGKLTKLKNGSYEVKTNDFCIKNDDD